MRCKFKLKNDDKVEVIAGKDKGRVGRILKIMGSERVFVEKINIIKRHTKPNVRNQQGGIIEKESSIHVSNLMLICSKCGKTVRIKKKILEDGTKVRVCKMCGESIEKKN